METLKKTIAAMAICLAALSASAAVLTQEGFETSRASFVADDSEADYSVVTNYLNDADKPAADPDYPFNVSGYGSKYLAVDTGDTILRHSFDASSSSVYFDAMVKFTTTEGGDAEYEEGSKFTLYLDAATSNLCAISGTSANNRAVVTNRLDSMTIVPGSWGRLTVNALRSDGVFAFQVRVNGTLLTASGVDTFYSMTADTTMSEVNFTGTGALDNVAVRTTAPTFGTAVATINSEDFATLAQAAAEAAAGDTILLLANNAEDINLTEGQTFKLKANGFSYSGTVYSYSGYRLKISDPDENGVITYSQAAPYKPSISINFTNAAGNGLTTSDDVGLSDYEVPGTSWNNFTIPNNAVEQTLGTVNAVDSTGAASVESGVSVTVSNQRGSYLCSLLTAASNPLQSYIDEATDKTTPTVTVSGIPYYRYRVIVYHSTDTGNVPFGYDTINGTNYTYVNDALTEGTTAWGDSGAYYGANVMSIGGNVLVTGELSGPTLTVVGHRAGGADNARGCIAAIQIIEIKPTVGENDLEIPVSGATVYTVSEAKELSGTVYLTGNGTLTLDGSAKISAATIDVGLNVTLNVNAALLDGTTFTGSGTVVYDGVAPVAGKGWIASDWTGTVWLKNQTISSFEGNQYGNAGSTIRFTGVTGFLQTNTYNSKGYVHTVPLELVDDGDTVALTYNNGWSGNLIKINTLKGTGTLKTQDSGLGEHIYIVDGSGFTGVFNLVGKYVYVGGSQPDSLDQANPDGKLEIRAGTTLTVSSGKTWTANGGFVVDGTLNVNGTLSSSHASKAVSGSGTVIYTGKAPNTGTAWWKENWTGTVEIKDYATSLGNFNLTAYGNSESKVCMNGANGYLLSKGSSGSHDIKELIIGSGGFTQNGSYSVVNEFVVPCKVTGSGTYTFSAAGTGQKTLYFTGDMSEFAGVISIGGTNNRVLVGTSTDRAFTANTLIVGDDGVLSIASGKTWNPSSGMFIDNGGLVVNNGFIWTTGGITVDGELRAPNHKDYFGGGTTITTTDNGVFTLTSTGNGEESETDTSYARITGTGTLKYEGTGWRALSTNNFPTAMTLANEQAGDILLSRTLTYTIGSLSGTKNIQGNYGSGARYLRVLQSKDTEWSGKVIADDSDRFKGLTVAPGASAAGTLTLSGTQVKSQTLTVESGAKVNLTGTWIGNVTVAGTFGGTGTVTGNLTLSDGATIKVNDMSDLLTVTGNLTTTAGTTVKIELPAGARKGMKFIDVTGTIAIDPGTKFEVYVGGERKRYLSAKALKDGSGVKVTCPPFQVRFLSPSSSAAN